MSRLGWLAGLLVASASIGCDQEEAEPQAETKPPATATPPASTPPAGGTTAGQAQANAADQAFIDHMVPHHEMAVMMADEALQKAHHAETKAFAQKVKDDQAREIAQMKNWRRQWFGSDATPPMDHSQMKPLEGDYDEAWAQEMIVHHQGAIDASNKALAEASRPEIKTMAQTIIAAQKKEQDELRGYIEKWKGTAGH